jgi:hypothetical protein
VEIINGSQEKDLKPFFTTNVNVVNCGKTD